MMYMSIYEPERSVKALSAVVPMLICLFFGLLLSREILSDEAPTANDIQIQATPGQLLGEQLAESYRNIVEPGQTISWQVYLPNNDSTDQPGVFVYVSPMKTGRIDSRWREVMDQQNLIYIAADKSGNKVPTIRRMVMATLAVRALAQNYSFDVGRVIVSGYSGGGRVASRLATQYPEVFTGALYICGVDFWKKDKTPKVDRVIRNRFVFFTGSRDFNQNETRRIYKRYLNAGAQHSKLIVVPGLGHKHPDAAYLTEALQFLLGRG